MAIMNMFKDIEEDMNKCLNKDHENTNSWMNIEKNQHMKAQFTKEIESLKKINTEIKLEMNNWVYQAK